MVDVVGDDDEIWMGALICVVQLVDLSHLEKRSYHQSCSCQLAHLGVIFTSNIKKPRELGEEPHFICPTIEYK